MPASRPLVKGVYKGRPVTFDHAKIIALRKEGLGATEIALAVGCKRGNVHKALKAAGLPKRRPSGLLPAPAVLDRLRLALPLP